MTDADHASERPRRRPESLPAVDLPDRVAAGDSLLVMFRTAGCSICAAMEPVLDGVARSVDVPVVTVNPRDHPPLVETHRITSVPTFVLFSGGREAARLADGFVPAEDLVAFVEDNR